MCNMSTCVTLCMWYVTSHLSRRNLWGFILHVTLCMWYVTNAICHGATCDMHSASSCSSLLHPLALTIPYHTGDILYVTFCVWYWSQIICVVLCHLYQTSDTRHLICDIVWYLTRASVGLQLCAIAIASFFSISFHHTTTSHPFSLSDNLKYPNPCHRSLCDKFIFLSFNICRIQLTAWYSAEQAYQTKSNESFRPRVTD